MQLTVFRYKRSFTKLMNCWNTSLWNSEFFAPHPKLYEEEETFFEPDIYPPDQVVDPLAFLPLDNVTPTT